jgi:DNA-binding MarR family transcriptional regulator
MPAERRFESLEPKRALNLRQLLLKASRKVNSRVVGELRARGFSSLRSMHTTLLSNMDLAGSSVTATAERAGITKQAMGRLAVELETAGYLRIESDPEDLRVRILRFTPSGERLMRESLDVMSELERGFGRRLGREPYRALREGLIALQSLSD